MYRIIATILFVLFLVQGAISQPLNDFFNSSNAFFAKHVENGLVDYNAIHQNPDELNAIIELAEGLEIDIENKKAYQAFWINGYNLHVIKGIVDNYPVKSPLDIKGFFDVTKRKIGGLEISLNAIENELLRAKFPYEPRFHFVLVCAGLGCPPIINEAYNPKNLEDQLQQQTEMALNNQNFIRVKGKKVLLSQIFEWYKGDFVQGERTEIDFINTYRKDKLDAKSKVGYYPYDWTLNEIK